MTPVRNAQDILNTAFDRLKAQNQMLSLRSLASRMGISPSYLSKMMTGKKMIPWHLLPVLRDGLHLDVVETNNLQRQVLEQIEEQEILPLTGLKSLREQSPELGEYKSFTKNDFLLLEKWFYIPLLNLVTLKSFKNDPTWIAKKMNMPEKEVVTALKELIGAGYLENQDGRLQVTDQKARFPTSKSHERVRNFHQMMMKKALDTLTTKTTDVDFQERLINGVSFAGNSKKIQEAQVILNRAIYEVAELMSQDMDGSLDEQVFQINLQFFKLTE